MPTAPSEEEVISWFDTLSNWGRWGADDELGTLNLITPEVRRRAVATVKEGTCVSCSWDVPTGDLGFERVVTAVDKFLCSDLVVHGWDLARAARLDDGMEDEDIERVRRYMESMGEGLRSPGAFGPEVEAPPDADNQGRLLAFLGRRP